MVTGVLEIVGGLEAMADLASSITKVVKRLRQLRNVVKFAKAEFSELYDETDLFSYVVSQLHHTMSEASLTTRKGPTAIQDTELVTKVVASGKRILTKLRTILDKAKRLSTNHRNGLLGRVNLLILSLKWQQSRQDVELVKADLNSGKQSISLVLQFCVIRTLLDKINKLEATGQPVPAQLRTQLYVQIVSPVTKY